MIARGKSVPYGARSHTRVTARSPGIPELRVVIAGPHEDRPWRMRKLRLDDPTFNRRGAVYTNDVGLARTWLGEELRSLIVALPYRMELRGGVITATIGELEDSAEQLEKAIRTVARIATRFAELRRAWMTMATDARILDAGSRKHLLAKLPALEIRHGAAKVTISPWRGAVASRRHGRSFFTTLRAERRAHVLDGYAIHPTFAERALRPRHRLRARRLDPPPLDRWEIECDNEERMRARIAAPIPELLERCGAAIIIATRREVTVYVPGLMVDPGQFRAALALTAKLAVEIETEAAGPYR